MNNYAILVCYYGEYYKKSLRTFEELLKQSFGNDFEILVVFNSTYPEVETNKHLSIQGSNSGWEFSGWDEGVKYLERRYQLNDSDTLIFANDTFCQHRKFTFINKYIFSKAFRNIRFKRNLVGDINSLSEKFCLAGLVGQSWISTYLFGSNYYNIKLLMPFDSVGSDAVLSKLVTINDNELHISNSSKNITLHLTSWFLGNSEGWYKKEGVDNTLLLKKVDAVINEKLFSLKALVKEIQIESVYENKLYWFLRKAQNKLFDSLSRLG